jgi:hypothetical protein
VDFTSSRPGRACVRRVHLRCVLPSHGAGALPARCQPSCRSTRWRWRLDSGACRTLRRDGRLEGLIHHSDAGWKYTAIRYAERLTDAGAPASIGSAVDSYDNAMADPAQPVQDHCRLRLRRLPVHPYRRPPRATANVSSTRHRTHAGIRGESTTSATPASWTSQRKIWTPNVRCDTVQQQESVTNR